MNTSDKIKNELIVLKINLKLIHLIKYFLLNRLIILLLLLLIQQNIFWS